MTHRCPSSAVFVTQFSPPLRQRLLLLLPLVFCAFQLAGCQQLLHAFAVFRHADRAPINLPENLSILPPELVARFWRGSGQILDSGIDAASQLGACLRVRYVDGGARVLDGRMIPGQFSLRSSPVTRCVQTGQAVVAKMFNGSAGPASPVPVYLPVGDGEPNIALPRSCRFDRLPPSSGNPVSQKIALELAANKSTYWREHSVGQNEIFADMVALNASLVPDWYSPEAAAEARQIYAQVGRTLFFSNPNATTDPEIAVAIGPLISHILNIFGNYSTNSASSMGRPVFTAVSTHDFVIDILAVALNLSDRLETVKPPFLSTFLVELWQLPDVEGGYGVKVYFGNASCDFRDLTSLARGCGGNSSCPLSSFSTAFRPLASTDPLNCPPLDVAFSTGTGGIAAAEPSALQLILATPGLLIGWFTPLAVFFLLAALSLGAFSIYLYKRAGQLAEQLEKALKDRRSLQQGLSNSSRAGSGGSPAAGSPVHFTAPPPPGTTVVVEQIPAAQPPPPKPAAPLRHDYPTDARVL